jgi:hypothetical protein
MQIKSARFTEEQLFLTLLTGPLPAAPHPCVPSGMLLPATPASFGLLLPRHQTARS